MTILGSLLGPVRSLRDYLALPAQARAERGRDLRCGLGEDPGPARAIEEGLRWLGTAQDSSPTRDGGVARHFSFIGGWGASYPETTGYIAQTIVTQAQARRDEGLHRRARRMLDWLAGIQLPGGGFRGGMINQTPVVPVTFNTGQILLGLAAGVGAYDEYRPVLRAAADWLATTQDPDGCWRRHPTPFAAPGEKAYETHVAWGLFEAARVEPNPAWADAALRNVHWALGRQQPNGWFQDCCLNDPTAPLTHTLGYVLRGLVEAHRFTGDPALLDAARRTADGLLSAVRPDGALPGRLDQHWLPRVKWSCLTGNVQVAHSWLMLYQATSHRPYRDAALAANRFVRRTMQYGGPDETRGGVKGSFPVHGDYGRYQYLNWACKFMVDANALELSVGAA